LTKFEPEQLSVAPVTHSEKSALAPGAPVSGLVLMSEPMMVTVQAPACGFEIQTFSTVSIVLRLPPETDSLLPRNPAFP